uniref:Uncharacterized protein n=1 Tax=Heterobasidion irregulare TaxID=984962 RepID=A0A075DD13_9AGAM|nr:hypothetical protein [Heterobasidion irregulare]AHK09754.1 hypothetical protein [Heterobasidion irregulare]
MKNKFISTWKYVVGGSTVLAYQSWYESYKSTKSAAKLNERLESMEISINDIDVKIDRCIDPELKSKLIVEKGELNNSLENLKTVHEAYIGKSQGVAQNSNESTKLFEEYNDQFHRAFKIVLEKAEEIDKSLNNSSNENKFIDMNFIWEKITEYKEFLSTLSFTELCLVMNILMSIFIFTCLASIIFAVYGNFLIDKLSLEQKYPKLSSLIRIRVNLQHYYIMINTLFIVLGLIFIVYINFMTFIHG